MTSLVIAEHDNATLKGATLNTVTAAVQCGGEVHVLVAGANAAAAAAAAAQIAGVSKVLHADSAALAHGLAGLVNGMNLTGIAEGIETAMQANILRAQGWRLGQGYFFGRPADSPVADLFTKDAIDA